MEQAHVQGLVTDTPLQHARCCPAAGAGLFSTYGARPHAHLATSELPSNSCLRFRPLSASQSVTRRTGAEVSSPCPPTAPPHTHTQAGASWRLRTNRDLAEASGAVCGLPLCGDLRYPKKQNACESWSWLSPLPHHARTPESEARRNIAENNQDIDCAGRLR